MRVAVIERVFLRDPDADIGALLQARIDDGLRWHDRIAARCEDVRGKLEAFLARHGGMRLAFLRLEADRLDVPVHWYRARLEAGVETLDQRLQPKIEILALYSARELASTIKKLGARHLRLVRALERLKANGAALEIDLAAEQFICSNRLSLGDVAAGLCSRRDHGIAGDGIDVRRHLCLHEGRISLQSMFNLKVETRFLLSGELRSDGS